MSSEEKNLIQGKVVAPSTPRTRKGLYWGYNVRLVEKLSQVFTKSPFKGGYDLTLGTSERGDNIDNCQQLSKASQINKPTQKVKHFGFLRPAIVKFVVSRRLIYIADTALAENLDLTVTF